MQISECPNCYSRVVFQDNGLCPSCSKHPSAGDATRTKVTLHESQNLPPQCLGCGVDTDSWVSIRRALTPASRAWGRAVLKGLLLPFMLVGVLGVLFSKFYTADEIVKQVRIKIPVCPRCRSRHLPQEDWIDYEEGTIAFIVPKTVAVHLR